MASWAVHFRVADYFLDKIKNLDKTAFIIGNIAPDCGVPCKNGYNPPSTVTHRTHCGNYKGNCDYQSIYDDFIKNETDKKALSFWTGYFVHYVTDCLWVKSIYDPLESKYGRLHFNKQISKEIRREWYNLDFEYFRDNRSKSFEIFKQTEGFFEEYPDFYSNGTISERMKYIKKFYSENSPEIINYSYTTPKDIEKFLSISCPIIDNELSLRNINL